jgi:MSHA pilin protein MshC
MKKAEQGFSLIELITVMILLGILSVTFFSRLGPVSTAAVQAGRDDIIAALFFAQQTAMMRSSNGNIRLVITSNTVSVTENNNPIAVSSNYYPLTLPKGVIVTSTPATFSFDKLGRTAAGVINLTGSGNSSGTSARIQVEASGYAYAN